MYGSPQTRLGIRYRVIARRHRGIRTDEDGGGILGFKIESIRAVVNIRDFVKPGIDYVDFGPADISFDMETRPHPHLTTLSDCREHVKRELAGSPVRIM